MSALTHFCQIRSELTCCLPHAIFPIYWCLFNFEWSLKQQRKRQRKQRRKKAGLTKKSTGRDYADVVISVNTSCKWDVLPEFTTCWWGYLPDWFPTVTPIFITTNNSPTGGNVSALVALLEGTSHEDQVLNHVFQQQMFPGSVVCNMKLRRAVEILCSHVRRGYGR